MKGNYKKGRRESEGESECRKGGEEGWGGCASDGVYCLWEVNDGPA